MESPKSHHNHFRELAALLVERLALSHAIGDRTILTSGEIEWGNWVPWTSIPQIDIPLGPGVYGIVYKDDPGGERLQIGEAIDLGKHVREYLFRDRRLKAVGGKIKANEDVTRLLVRWSDISRLFLSQRISGGDLVML